MPKARNSSKAHTYQREYPAEFKVNPAGDLFVCYASPLSTATKNSVLKSTGQRQASGKNANNMFSLPAAVLSQLKETVQGQGCPCLHVSRQITLQAKKPSDCVTLCWPGASGAIGDCLSRLCSSTCRGRNKPHSTNHSSQEGRYSLSLTKVNLTNKNFWIY